MALKETLERLDADVRTLRTSKAKTEAEVMALHQAERAQATIERAAS